MKIMINQPFCRFQNTLAALQECAESLADSGFTPFVDISLAERTAAQEMIKLCRELADDYLD